MGFPLPSQASGAAGPAPLRASGSRLPGAGGHRIVVFGVRGGVPQWQPLRSARTTGAVVTACATGPHGSEATDTVKYREHSPMTMANRGTQ